MCGLPKAFIRYLGIVTIIFTGGKGYKIYLYRESGFFKILAFKGTIRKFLNVVAAYIEDLKYPHSAYLITLFSCQCPFQQYVNNII
jgi:hypothetical protein